ncbi:hypothetical protein FHR71_001573 [Methylobacterium sp. RAS18]|nr:hypothetical protein [Methylobacterium sp. RAS18]
MLMRTYLLAAGALLLFGAEPVSAQVCQGGQTCAEKGCKGPCFEETNPDGTCSASCLSGLVPEANEADRKMNMSIYGLDKNQKKKILDILKNR